MAIAHAAGESREFPGVWGGVWFGSVWLFMCTSRWAGWLLLWRWPRYGRLVRNVAVLGAGPAAIALARRLKASNEARLVGVFTESGAQLDLQGRLPLVHWRSEDRRVGRGCWCNDRPWRSRTPS